jgi:hypothetical protein
MDKEAQKALMRASVAEGRTLIERWSGMVDHVTEGRMERARIAAGFLPPGCCVADVGCGAAMPLEAVLPAGSRYLPVDVVKRDERTVVVDLNVERLPDLGADVVVALGLIEYLNDVPAFLGQIGCDAVISYAPADRLPTRDRASSGWKNSYTVESLSELFETTGFRIAAQVQCPGKQQIWSLRADR